MEVPISELPTSDKGERKKTPTGVLRDAIDEIGTPVAGEDELRVAKLAATEAVDNGLQNGSKVKAVVTEDNGSLEIKVTNSDTPGDSSFDCLKGDDHSNDDLLCHGRGLFMAESELNRIGGEISLEPEEGAHTTIIKVPADKTKTKTKPTG